MISWEDVTKAVGKASAERSDAARHALRECWDRTLATDHAQRCILAHYLADQQDELMDEIKWDERALAEHANVSDADLAPVGVPSAVGFLPSLHLNLGDDYLRAGEVDRACSSLEAARAAEPLLPEHGYGAMIRSGINRLAQRLDATR